MEHIERFGSWGALIGAFLGALSPALAAHALSDADRDVWELVPYFIIPSALLGYLVFGAVGMLVGMIWRILNHRSIPHEDELPIAKP